VRRKPRVWVKPKQNSGKDVVVLDDFIFGEPTAVPEPASLSIIGLGLLALLRTRGKTLSSKQLRSAWSLTIRFA